MNFDTIYTYLVVLREAASGKESPALVQAPTLTDAVKAAKVAQMQTVENDQRWYAISALQLPGTGVSLSELVEPDVS